MLSVKDLAAELKVSESYALRLMRKYVGKGVIVVPAGGGLGNRAVYRMPRPVFDRLLAQWSKPGR